MRSMTGFGRGESANGNLTLEVSSVNRKQLELRFTLPRELGVLEAELRPVLAAAISRGAVSVRLTVNETATTGGLHLDRELLRHLVTEARAAAEELALKHDLSIADFLAYPGVMVQSTLSAADPEFHRQLTEALEMALRQFNQMREAEGEALRRDLTGRLEKLEGLLHAILPLTADLPELNRKRLLEKLQAANLPVDRDDERLLKEVVLYADRGDTSEETTRLASHFAQFRNFLNVEQDAVGRSMDFLLQEMFREITTLGNKAQGGEVSPLVVAFKTELEKVREQVQNIE